MKTSLKSFLLLGSLTLGAATMAQGADLFYTWTGASSDDWDDLGNWVDSIQPVDLGFGIRSEDTGNISTVTIQNGTYLPLVNVPTYANERGGRRTPQFVIEDGAELDIRGNAVKYNGGTTGSTRTIATVGLGATLTMGSDSGADFIPARDGDATHSFDINGGTFNIVSNRIDFGFNTNRLSDWNLDGGTVNARKTDDSRGVWLFGSRDGGSTGTSTVTLTNGSTWDGGFWIGNLETAGTPNVTFDLQDEASQVIFATNGGEIQTVEAAEAWEGKLWTSSTFGAENLQYDVSGGLLTITVVGSAPLGPLNIELVGDDAVLTWSGAGVLQSDDDLQGTWTDVDGGMATSPYPATGPLTGKEFYRLRAE